MPTWTVIYQNAYLPLLVALATASFVWGDVWVRWTAAATLIPMAGLEFVSRTYTTILWPAVVADVVLLVSYLAISLRAPRAWLLTITGMQLLSVLGHLGKATHLEISALTYAILQGGMAYLQLILLGAGLIAGIRLSRSKASRSATGMPAGTTANID